MCVGTGVCELSKVLEFFTGGQHYFLNECLVLFFC